MHCCSIKNADTYVAHNLYIPKEVKLGEEKYVLTRIGGAAFEDPNSGNNQLISGKLFFPEKCTEIGVQAFIKCIELTDVDLFNVENIDIGAFGGCVKITSINLNGQKFNHDKALGNNCFSNCTNLSSISLFKSIKNIGSYCFLNIKDSCILSLNDLTQGQSSCGYQIQAITTW
jgi:hypothetical protein